MKRKLKNKSFVKKTGRIENLFKGTCEFEKIIIVRNILEMWF